jgi:TetR/AcrR family transcriptional regulator, cholesterol catabolism regulator
MASRTASKKGSSRPGSKGAEPTGAKSRQDILDAAARLLRSQGYKATTLRDIAEEVGIRAGSIYYHFASKEEIVATVMNEGVDRVFDAVTAALSEIPGTATVRERIAAAVAAHLNALLKYSDYTSAGLKSYTDAPEPVRQAARQHRRRYEDIWAKLVDEAVAAGAVPGGVSADTLRRAALGMMNWSPEWYRAGRDSIERLADEFTAILLR